MTRAEALAEARRRWGKHAFADWFTTHDDPPEHVFKVGYFSYPGMGTEREHWMGAGADADAAFADADRRDTGRNG